MITMSSTGVNGCWLGNQLFQHAMLLSIKHVKGYEIIYPAINGQTNDHKISGQITSTNQLDLLECFNIQARSIDRGELCRLIRNRYKEKYFNFNHEVFDQPDYTDFDGWFQTEKYFENNKDIIKNEFTFKNDIQQYCIEYLNTLPLSGKDKVSIHVRRGTFCGQSPVSDALTMDYYNKALQHFDLENQHFLVFSDDIAWCEANFPNNFIFIKTNNKFYDMCLQNMCEHHITANSTFGWWGAWLGYNTNKKIVTPAKWLKPGVSLNTEDYLPNEWIKI